MKTIGLSRTLLAVGVGVVLGLAPVSATAQTAEERAGARAAATEGAEAFEQGRWQDAVDLFQRAESLVHAPPHLLYMARANEKLGKLVKASELYNKITREKLSSDAPDAFRQAQADAVKELQSVEPRLASLTVKVEAPADVPFQVTMDGEEVPSALVGIARPVDPGQHEILVTARGYKAEPARVTLAEGGSDTATLALVEEPGAAPAGGAQSEPPAAAQTPVTGSPTPPPTEDTRGGPNGLRIGSYVALGVGLVGIGVGTGFGIKSRGDRSDADTREEEFLADCGDSCQSDDPRAQEIDSLDQDAKRELTESAVGFAVGGVGLATGVVLFVLSSKKKQSARLEHPKVRGWVGIGSVGVSGRF